jgi:hypothetical protein
MNVIHMDVAVNFAILLDADAPNALTADEVKARLQAAVCPAINDWRKGLANPVLVSDVAVSVAVPAAPAPAPAPVADPVPVDPTAGQAHVI